MSFTGCQTFGRSYTNEKHKQQGTRVWNVWSDAIIALEESLGASFLPVIGDAWGPQGPQGLVVIRQTPMEVDKEQQFYKVQIDYETDDSYNSNWNISVTSVRKEFAPYRTRTPYSVTPDHFDEPRYLGPAGYGGDETKYEYPVINRANDGFDPPIKDVRYLSKITLKRVVDKISDLGLPAAIDEIDDISDLYGWLGKMNTSTVNIAGIWGDPWTFKVDDIQANRLPQSDGTYDTEVTISILHDPETHANVQLNSGKTAIPDGLPPTEKKEIRDTSGNKATGLLGPQGEQVWVTTPFGATGAAAVNGPPYYVVFPTLEERYFEDLDLPTTWGD
jgi:hypothetical protein